jgi:hypothetical protein
MTFVLGSMLLTMAVLFVPGRLSPTGVMKWWPFTFFVVSIGLLLMGVVSL